MEKQDLEKRTKEFSLAVIKFVASLPNTRVADVLGRQLLKCGTSIGANYREANHAESRADFIHKIGIIEKEASETQYWLELYDGSELGEPEKRRVLMKEASELVAIFTSIGRSTKK
jgi:four helix bundle protein